MTILVYLLMGLVLGVGILFVMAGKPWLLIVSLIAYLIAFARYGCTSH